jgi:hypothetical protein
LALLGFAVAALWALVNGLESYVRQEIVNRAAERLDAEVEIGEVEIEWLAPLRVRVEGVTVVTDPDGPLLEVESALVEARWGEVLSPPRRLRSIRIERPRVAIRIDAEGETNLPRLKRDGGGEGVTIGSLEVSGGELFLGERRVPIEVQAREVRARAAGAPGNVFAGALDAADIVVELPTGVAYAGAASARASWRDGDLLVLGGRLSGPELQVTLTEGAVQPGTREWRFDFAASGRAELLDHLGYDASRLDGDWQFDGSLEGQDGWRLNGRLSSPGLRWSDLSFRELSASVVAVPGRVSLEELRGSFGGAALVGEVVARLDEPGSPVHVDLEAAEGDLPALLAELDMSLPGVSGPWLGSGAYTFEAADPLAGRGSAEVEIGVADVAGKPLWRRRLGLELRNGEVGFVTLGDSGTGEMLSATGRYSIEGERGDRLSTERLGDWLAVVIGPPGEDTASFLPRAGAGTVEGKLSLAAASWSTRLTLDLRDVLAGEIEATRVRGALTVSPDGLRDMRLDLARPEGAMQVTGRVDLSGSGVAPGLDLRIDAVGWPAREAWRQLGLPLEVEGALTASANLTGPSDAPTVRFEASVRPPSEDDRATAEAAFDEGMPGIRSAGVVRVNGADAAADLEVRYDVEDWPAHEFAPLIGLPVEIRGRLTASGDLVGTTEALTGGFAGGVEAAAVAGVPLDSIEFRGDLEPGGVRLEGLEAHAAAGSLELAGWIPSDEGEAELALGSTALDLAMAPFDELMPEGVGGAIRLAGELRGSLAAPDLSLDLEAEDLSMAGREASTAAPTFLTVRLQDGRLAAKGSIGNLLTIGGGGRLDGEAMDLDLEVASEELGSLLDWMLPAEAPDLAGSFAGAVRLRGEVGGPAFEPELLLDRVALDYAGRHLEALEPVTARYSDGAVQIDSLFLGNDGTGSEFFVFGRAPLGEGEPLDLRVQLSVSTRWMELALPGWDLAGGTMEGIASVEGTLAKPEVSGQGEIVQESLRLPGLPQRVEQLRGVLLFYPEEVVVDEAEARFAGGRVRAAGNLSPYVEAGPEYRFQLVATGLQLRYPEDWQLRADADLILASAPDGRQVRGQVLVSRALYAEDVAIGITQLLQGAFTRRPELVEETDEMLATTQVNVAIRGDDALRVRNNVADLHGDVDLVVRGNLARPVIFGNVRIEPGGTLLYSGNEYEVARAELNFVNPHRVEPVIDLEATTRLREYDVTLNLAGTLERLDVSFASNPPLADLDVLALLAGGEETVGTGAGSGTGVTAESFLAGQAASVVAERVNRLFGLDKFRIDPLTGDSGGLSSARVTVGKRLSRDLFATYSYDPSTNERQILELEWQISRQLTLIATQNGDDSYAVDARWEKSFR